MTSSRWRRAVPQGPVGFRLPLEELSQIPVPARLGQNVPGQKADVLQGPLGPLVEHRLGRGGLSLPGGGHHLLGGLRDPGSLGGGESHHRAAQPLGQKVQVQGLSPALEQVQAVHRHHRGYPQLQKLSGQVEAPLQAGPVHQV